MLRLTTEGAGSTTIERIETLEHAIGVSFPASHRAFLLKFNGGRPSPAEISGWRASRNRIVSVHFFFGVDDKVESCDLAWNFRVMRDRLPKLVIPIATDEYGNLFCLDLRTNGDGPVLFWDHELEHGNEFGLASTPIAMNFSMLLESLVDAP